MDMCTSPSRIFYTGLKTETGKNLCFFDSHYPCSDIVSIQRAEKQVHAHIPHDCKYVKSVGGHLFLHNYVDVPCGKCDECRMNYAKSWAFRCLMESKGSHDNWFLTLTFAPEFCPQNVDPKDVSGFMKRLRKRLGLEKIRFFGCGEYGEKNDRPHYHLILFNCPLPDLYKLDAEGHYGSKLIDEIWPFGFHYLGEVNEKTCAYVARYTSKKSGKRKGFLQMSRRPGIGYDYLRDHKDAYELDYINVVDSHGLRRIPLPRYFERIFPDLDFTDLKQARIERARNRAAAEALNHNLPIGEEFDDYKRQVAYNKASRLERNL